MDIPGPGDYELSSETLIDQPDNILDKLHPERVVDNEGNARDVYSFTTKEGNTVRALFYSPEELPFTNGLLDGKAGFVLGSKPPWRTDADWQTFTTSVQQASAYTHPLPHLATIEAVQSDKAVFFVESNPTSIFDLVLTLGADDPMIQSARRDSSHHVANPYVQTITDQIIAGKLFDDTGELRTEKNYEGEALAVLAMTGDEKAKQILDHKVSFLNTLDANRAQQIQSENRSILEDPRVQELKLEELVAVHTTKYLPHRVGDHWEMQSTFDATQGKIPRASVHFSLNHPVESHMYGSWDDAPYAIIAPLPDLITRNGNPANLNTVDTFFEVSPDTTLTLPQTAYLVRPGEVTDGLFQDLGNNEIIYKGDLFKPDDIIALQQVLTPGKQAKLNEDLQDMIAYATFKPPYRTQLSYEEQNRLANIFSDTLKERNLLDDLSKSEVSDTLLQLYASAGLGSILPDNLTTTLTTDIQAQLLTLVKKLAIENQLEQMGYTVQPGGTWAWGGSWDVTAQTLKLAVNMGLRVVPHQDHISHQLEEVLIGGLGVGPGLLTNLSAGEITPQQYRDRAYQFAKRRMDDITPVERRMLYRFGAI